MIEDNLAKYTEIFDFKKFNNILGFLETFLGNFGAIWVPCFEILGCMESNLCSYRRLFIYYFPQIISALKSYMIQVISIIWELYDYNIYIYKLCEKMSVIYWAR